MNIYKSSDDIWFLLVVSPDKIPALAEGIGRTDLLRDPRFADPAKLAANMGQLTAILDEIFSAQPMAHWREVFDKAHVTYGLVRDPQRRYQGSAVERERHRRSARGRWREPEKHDQQSYSSARRH